MKVVRSKLLGYCHGVSETVKNAKAVVVKGQRNNLPYYSIGNLIHNKAIVSFFSEKGLKVIEKPEEGEKGFALVRAHGIPDSLRESFTEAGYKLIDSTCINIRKSIKSIQTQAKSGRTIVILGIKNHAEAVCLLGVKTEGIKKYLVSDSADLDKLFVSVPFQTPICVITQTTFPESLFAELTGALKNHYPNCLIGNKLCQACIQRKKTALELSEKTGSIVVVGDKQSANTKDLANMVRNTGKPVFEVETVDDFDDNLDKTIKSFDSVGIVSGTSTPSFIIEQVASHLESL